MICAGIDAGSRSIKIILLEAESFQVVGSGLTDQGLQQADLTDRLLQDILRCQGLHLQDITRTVATGYGRRNVNVADTTITEITCHARGIRHVAPEAKTIIEVGGQDSKLIRLNHDGAVFDFDMNDRCAAGTGRFLEVVAERLELSLGQLGQLAARSSSPAAISSMCVVFAETEIIGLLSSGVKPEDIVAGVQTSIASRIMAMAGRELEEPIVFTGGVALIPGMADFLTAALDRPVAVAPDAQMTGALGAAILAVEQSRNSPE